MLKEAGLDRINHNLNSSRSFYPEICSTHTYDQRVNNIKMLQGLGFEICSGGIIGMGESKEDVVDMLMDLKAISLSPFRSISFFRFQGQDLQTVIFQD